MIDDEPASAADDNHTGRPAEASEDEKKRSFWKELPVLLVIAIVVALVVRTFVLQSFWIPSGSMEHTLERGDRVLVNKLVYEFTDPERGDVIVFKAPMEWRSNPEDEDFIKRVIAVGGDTVSYSRDEGRLSVNGRALDESAYLYHDPVSGAADLPSKDGYEFTVIVPEGRLWVMGDHRSASGDSRENYIRSGRDVSSATIPVDSVVGHAFVVMWPFERFHWLTVPETFDAVPASRSERSASRD
ncbi:signal peptidase I [Stackebrandtia albiflava]|uniref:Signal peptidase I n=1 Tax=Stackebrandtia albiflava TaxID=406432 RepID=A0A562VAL1_9ACTN|nr:signal peptidase I [Stackebrandtia albiflava]TWJ14847.1 signal peptidase I [Stackebrandtia albiflava]